MVGGATGTVDWSSGAIAGSAWVGTEEGCEFAAACTVKALTRLARADTETPVTRTRAERAGCLSRTARRALRADNRSSVIISSFEFEIVVFVLEVVIVIVILVLEVVVIVVIVVVARATATRP